MTRLQTRPDAQPATPLALLLPFVAIAMPGAAWAATGNSDNEPGIATATVVKPITVIHSDDNALNFGLFTAGTGGTVIVTTAGAGTTSAGVAFVPGSTTGADFFRVTGDSSRQFSIATASGSVSLSSGATMSFVTTPSAATMTLNTGGNANFTVGGTLTVASLQPVGAYRGSYTVTVTYS